MAPAGSYILMLALPEQRAIRVGRLGILSFKPGYYAYVGSAQGGLEGRIRRHLRADKKPHWHIDYLRREANVAGIMRIFSPLRAECALARALAEELAVIKGFGASDCGCSGHLFYSRERPDMVTAIAGVAEIAAHIGGGEYDWTEY